MQAPWQRQSHTWNPSTFQDVRTEEGEQSLLRRQIIEAMLEYQLPPHWAKCTHTGETYYWNRSTNQTTWNHPLSSCTLELSNALVDCRAAGRTASSASEATQARKRRLTEWVHRWREACARGAASWHSLGDDVSSTASLDRHGFQASGPTLEADLQFRLHFQCETLASLLSLPLPEACLHYGGVQQDTDAPGMHRSSARAQVQDQAPVIPSFPKTTSYPSNRSRHEIRRTESGQCFYVEHMPADNSCGFHGIGIDRQKAARLLRDKRSDPEVRDLVASDLLAAVQTNERASFPQEIRSDERLWASLATYYAKQQALDDLRREAKDFLTDMGANGRTQAIASQHGITEAVKLFFHEFKSKVAAQPSGPEKTRSIQMLGRCKMQERDLEKAAAESQEALASLRKQCHVQVDAYVSWVGSDASFWLSFVRGCGGSDRGGGLLDALAKVGGLTVRVWSEGSRAPLLELVHEAKFGDRIVNLWFQGDLGHFDRLTSM
eukprot:TRINITY_DN90571_c0_g1_i1.p1 TRINITY_DN90571_c0_g1~~TRINITY_DN90571_c0_g1_i1.p1  ORF type:complete len:492 (-),score=80.66 TRINITY_DN90571_c0_g1_i1:90-1565(-)